VVHGEDALRLNATVPPGVLNNQLDVIVTLCRMSTPEQRSPQTQQRPGERGQSTIEGLTAEQIEKLRSRPHCLRRSDGERGRLITNGLRTDDGGLCTLLLIQESDGAWTIHLGDYPEVTLPAVDMLALAEAILVRAR